MFIGLAIYGRGLYFYFESAIGLANDFIFFAFRLSFNTKEHRQKYVE